MSEPQKPERLIRPVKCHFCEEPLFYSDDDRYEPEVSVAVAQAINDSGFGFYAHVRCWNQRMEK